MTDTTLYIVARITPKPQHHEQAKHAIRDIVDVTRNEPGCRQFSLLEARDGETLHLFEEWDDAEALAHHHAQPYTKDVFENYKIWLAEPVQVTHLTKLA